MIRILCEYSHLTMEEKVNELMAKNPGAKLLSLSVHPMHNMYLGMTPPTVCNSWNEYLATMEVPS